MTSPVSDWEILIGKHLAGTGFLLAMLAPTLFYVATLAALAPIDPGPVLAGYTGLLLLGVFYLSAGLLLSALKYWEVEHDLIEERLAAMRSATAS